MLATLCATREKETKSGGCDRDGREEANDEEEEEEERKEKKFDRSERE